MRKKSTDTLTIAEMRNLAVNDRSDTDEYTVTTFCNNKHNTFNKSHC